MAGLFEAIDELAKAVAETPRDAQRPGWDVYRAAVRVVIEANDVAPAVVVLRSPQAEADVIEMLSQTLEHADDPTPPAWEAVAEACISRLQRP